MHACMHAPETHSKSKLIKMKKIVLVSALITLIAAGIILSTYTLVYAFPKSVYDIQKAQEWLWKARASTDLNKMAEYIQKGLAEIDHRQGNPCWYFPTAETDFGVIKNVLEENINSAQDVAAKESRGSYGYQRAIDNIEEAIIETNEHLEATQDWLTILSKTTISALIIWFVLFIVVIVLIWRIE